MSGFNKRRFPVAIVQNKQADRQARMAQMEITQTANLYMYHSHYDLHRSCLDHPPCLHVLTFPSCSNPVTGGGSQTWAAESPCKRMIAPKATNLRPTAAKMCASSESLANVSYVRYRWPHWLLGTEYRPKISAHKSIHTATNLPKHLRLMC